ncbi:MAG: DUF3300 domain-containing protein, partial [Filomicrobium sp.]
MSTTPSHPLRILSLLLGLVVLTFGAPGAFAQEQLDVPEQQDAQEEGPQDTLSEGQIEQLVAPIALYPDALLSQVLMASTYPLEVVEAARWVKENPDVKDDAIDEAMEGKDWDASIKSLAAIPDALEMLNQDLSWTQKLGDAFLAQQQDVLDAVQRLRLRAEEAGNLKSSKEIKVEKVAASSTSTGSSGGGVVTSSGSSSQVIVIEPANPEVVYVPAYNPTVVYGTWSYPSYPPYSWYPPGYVASNALWFGAGVVAGRALWGGCDWYRGSVNINVNRYNRYNRTNINRSNWNHNAKHRRGVPYKNRNTARKHGRNHVRNAKARENFRGRARQGQQQLKANRPGAGNRPGQRPGAGNRPGQGGKPGAGNRPGQKPGAGNRPGQGGKPGAGNRPGQKPGAGNRPGQGGKPGAGNRPGQKPGAGNRPGQGGKPGAGNRPGQKPGAGNRPGQGGKPGAGG